MANPTEGIPNEGKDWLAANTIDAATIYIGLLHTKTWGGGTIIETSTLAGLACEENGTGYARQSFTFPVTVNGIALVPSKTFGPGAATNWHADASCAFISPAASASVALFIWDLQTLGVDATFDMSVANSTLTTAAVNWFYANVFNP